MFIKDETETVHRHGIRIGWRPRYDHKGKEKAAKVDERPECLLLRGRNFQNFRAAQRCIGIHAQP